VNSDALVEVLAVTSLQVGITNTNICRNGNMNCQLSKLAFLFEEEVLIHVHPIICQFIKILK
jgi:hypothetical protein